MKKLHFFIPIFLLFVTYSVAQTPASVPVQISERTENIDGTLYFLHTVERGQTLYSISRTYQVATDQIKRTIFDKVEIQIGETLLIPANHQQSAQPKISITEFENQTDVPTTADTIRQVFENQPKSVLNVALMLPLYLNQVEQIRSNTRSNQTNTRPPLPFSFISFYHGATLATQVFENDNVKIKVQVFDVTEDENTIRRLIDNQSLNDMDIIVGPVFARSFRVASDFAKQKEIFIVNPLSDRDDILENNPFVVKINTSEKNQLHALLEYVAKNHVGQRIVILSNDSIATERERSNQARQFFENRVDDVIFIDISRDRLAQLTNSLSNTKENAIVYLARNEAFFTQIATQISKRNSTNILYCLEKLPQIEFTDLLYLNDLQTHYVDPFFVDFENRDVRNFDRLFFENFRTIPDALVYRGYDVMSYVFQLLKIGNTNYGNFLENMPFKGFHNTIQLYRTNPTQGLENRSTNILKIDSSQLKRVNN